MMSNETTRHMTLEDAVKEATLGIYVLVPQTRPARFGTHLDVPYVEAMLAEMVKARTYVHCFTQADTTIEERCMLLDVTPNMSTELEEMLASDSFYYVESEDT